LCGAARNGSPLRLPAAPGLAVSVVAIKHDGSFDQDTFGLLQATAKIAVPAANFYWVVAGTFFAEVIAMAANCSPTTGVVAPPPSVDALRDVARMTVKKLKARLKSLLAPTDGNKMALAQRLADRFGPEYKSRWTQRRRTELAVSPRA
jgi:hypothetical protein